MINVSTIFFSPLFGSSHKAPRIRLYYSSFKNKDIVSSFYGLPSRTEDVLILEALSDHYEYNGCVRLTNLIKKIAGLFGLETIGRHLGVNCISRKAMKDGCLLNADLVFTQPYFWPVVKEAKKKGLPVLLEVDSAHPLEWWNILREREKKNNIPRWRADPWNYWPYVKMALKSIEVADKIIVFSDYAEETFLKRGFSKDRLVKLRPSLNISFTQVEKKGENPKFIFASNHAMRKGLDLVLEAWSLYLKSGGKGELYIYGKKSPSFDKIFSRFGDLPKVYYLGHASLQEIFSEERCVFLSPSFSEGRPRTVLEAMSCGHPIIATFAGSADVIEDGKTGWLIKPESESLHQAMLKVDNVWPNDLQKFIDNVKLKFKEGDSLDYYGQVSNIIESLVDNKK